MLTNNVINVQIQKEYMKSVYNEYESTVWRMRRMCKCGRLVDARVNINYALASLKHLGETQMRGWFGACVLNILEVLHYLPKARSLACAYVNMICSSSVTKLPYSYGSIANYWSSENIALKASKSRVSTRHLRLYLINTAHTCVYMYIHIMPYPWKLEAYSYKSERKQNRRGRGREPRVKIMLQSRLSLLVSL